MTDQKNGLSQKQISELREKFGYNKLNEKKKKTTFQRFAEQFKDVMILILLVAAAISFVIACIDRKVEADAKKAKELESKSKKKR